VNPIRKRIGRLHVITDTVVQRRYDHVQLARLAIKGGADSIQLRDKNASDDELVSVARGVLAVCRDSGVPLLINDRVHVAAEVDADGVHLGRTDMPIEEARKILGRAAVIGGSAGTLEDAVDVENAGADYVGFGHIFPTGSKSKPGEPVGLGELGRVCNSVGIPVIAIGGISADNVGDVAAAGTWGVAVIGAVCGAEDPESGAREIHDILSNVFDM
jgi:thiamine-phosphate pyrophosphorylase